MRLRRVAVSRAAAENGGRPLSGVEPATAETGEELFVADDEVDRVRSFGGGRTGRRTRR